MTVVSNEPLPEHGPLLEREAELAALEAALSGLASGASGSLLIEGPAGIGKTRLMGELRLRAEQRGALVLPTVGSEMEQDFGFGLVRQLFGPVLTSRDPEQRAQLLSGSAGLAAGVFGMEQGAGLHGAADEGVLYGLYWLVVALAEERPIAIAIDDAHWADPPSLRFARYLGRRLEGLGVLLALAARPAEPGARNDLLADFVTDLDPRVIRPERLGRAATSELIRSLRGTDPPPELEERCASATGGNPFLIREFLAELEGGEGADGSSSFGRSDVGRGAIGASAMRRAGRLDPRAGALLQAAAILGDDARLDVVSELAAIEFDDASALVGSLVAASILTGGSRIGFAHPLIRQSVIEVTPAPERATAHGRAANLLRDRGAAPEVVASHILLAHPGSVAGAVGVLAEAARDAERRGAPESTVAFLRRALEESPDPAPPPNLLRRLGNAELALRDPTAVQHLEMAAIATDDLDESVAITVQLADTLTAAGMWDEGVAAIERGLARVQGKDVARVLDLEAVQTGALGFDPARRSDYESELPRLLDLARRHPGDAAGLLRGVLGAIGSMTDAPRDQVLELAAFDPRRLTFEYLPGHESAFVMQAPLSLIVIDELADCDAVATALLADAGARGSLGAAMGGRGYSAAMHTRRGDLAAAEADLRLAVELIQENDLSLLFLTSTLIFCIDALTERKGLVDVAGVVEDLELPPRFAATVSGGQLSEVRGAIRLSQGRREEARADFEDAAAIFAPMKVGPRLNQWRSRLALSLPHDEREEALRLAREEADLARTAASPRAEAAASRVLGLLEGGAGGLRLLERSVAAAEECPSGVETARSLAALGGALRRNGERSEARKQLRRAVDLARKAGAERLIDEIVAEIRLAGGRLPQREQSGAGSLTPAELRVASTAAAGATNSEIAQSLFVSLRTVEMHLTNTYRKLEITSRAELAKALDSAAPQIDP
jgi:DNA-binding CsgD family transcriptional regulator